jgi:hypothetical protein
MSNFLEETILKRIKAMNIRDVFKQAARQVIEKLSNIALAVKITLTATPASTRPAMAMAAALSPALALGGGGGGPRPRARPLLRRTDK